ncbi:UbiA prenyltransferase family protein [Cavenderia fasciculata]|uniref:UbiA prenyltransferase family protein n=1 Tax=Cavenderia fasciculata TaxID=261658 RepID=F4Q9T1_CACFS|nr:UbiA prenyltransferase family protein [Cavenderia fasciculata]EGG15450.1 UbiA prenyltransferase family protein [Cavenderia fasciculata]|eukprot:XP_004354192.1 UbiA prenyltransferase family protein [Cavenderia fasciculata]
MSTTLRKVEKNNNNKKSGGVVVDSTATAKDTAVNSSSKKNKNSSSSSNVKPNLKSFIMALRPWSLTASTGTVAIGAAVAFKEVEQFDPINFAITMIGAIGLQCLSNLMNSYFDHANEVDTHESAADRTLFDYGLTRTNVVWMIGGTLTACVAALIALMVRIGDINTIVGELIPLCFCGFILFACYTSGPIPLKYYAMGDLTIFIEFGPILALGGFIGQTNFLALSPIYYCIPTAFLVTAILHVNNTRDAKSDKDANVSTLANILGQNNSFILLVIYYSLAYGMIVYMALKQNSQMMLLPFILLPKVFTLFKKFYNQQWDQLDAEAAIISFFFAGLHTIGILVSDYQ